MEIWLKVNLSLSLRGKQPDEKYASDRVGSFQAFSGRSLDSAALQ
jgi:hypothetical protein